MISSWNLPDPEYPSCRQAMLASIVAHPSSHTVPQSPFRHTSTLPFKLEDPPLTLMFPCEHTVWCINADDFCFNVRIVIVKKTYKLCMQPLHHQSGNSRQCDCHRYSQLIWIELWCRLYHQELWWCLCFVRSEHCCMQLHLSEGELE